MHHRAVWPGLLRKQAWRRLSFSGARGSGGSMVGLGSGGTRSAAVAAAWLFCSVCIWYAFFVYTASNNGFYAGHRHEPAAASAPHQQQQQQQAQRSDADGGAFPAAPGCVTQWKETIPGMYTILSPFKGHINYKEFFEHYSYSPLLDRLIVVWANDDDDPPPDWSMFPKVRVVVQSKDPLVTERGMPIDFSLNNRFRPYEIIRTEAVFSVDNDMLVPTEYIDFMLEAFLESPHRIIGPSVRLALPSQNPKYAGKGFYEIHWPGWSSHAVPGHNMSYNLVYTNAAMLHRELLNEYTCRTPPQLLDMVLRNRSCEDIVMNVVAYHKWHERPLGMTSSTRCIDNYGVAYALHRDTGGLAKKGDMDSYPLFRGRCYNLACKAFGLDQVPAGTVLAAAYDDQDRCRAAAKHSKIKDK